MRVLLVEDNEIVRGILVTVLSEWFSLESTHDAFSALALLADEDFDVLITDINLPGMTGVDLAKAARKISSACLIALTGITLDAASAAWFDHVIHKPVMREELKGAIDGC